MSTTLAQYRSAVSSKLGLDNSTSGDQGFIDLWVNEGVTDVLMRTSCRVRCATMTLTAGTWKYTLDSSIMLIKQMWVTSGGQDYRLTQVTDDELIAMQVLSSTPISPIQYYAVGGSDFLLLYPTPSLSTDTLNIEYIPRPTVLSASSDTPSEIPSQYQKAVEFYACREAAEFSGDTDSQFGARYAQSYELWIRRIKKWVALSGNHRLPRAVVAYGRPYLVPHDRSRYPNW